ncbi:N-ethylammeline chlorohydrolase [Candidatus Bathyarchaeota archaeon]|nr:MAG: N-ethylammeline chlorohydrolase [Candidatus Bathyarchaeota archaeon]
MNLIIENATIITMSKKGTIKNGAIVIEHDAIIDVAKTSEIKRKYSRGYERINAENKVVTPGFVNTHQHAAMSLLRGYADDLPLQEWLEKWIWPLEKHMRSEDIYLGALLTAVESIMSGITTVNTMYHYAEKGNEAEAFAEAGLRGVIGHVCFSWRKEHDKKALEHLARNWHNAKNGLIRVSVDPHSPYTVDAEYMQELRKLTNELNEKYGSVSKPIIWHTHIAETEDEKEKIENTFNVKLEGGVFEYLDSLGVLGDDVIAAHCVALTPKDIQIMRKRNVKVSHNPVSNLKLASGISPVPQMLKNGITVSLGTDSPCSNNNTDMFYLMKTASLLHKGVSKNPTVMPAEQVLKMATINGAKALSWDMEIGSLEPGKKADLAIIDFKKPHLCPLYNEASHIVYAANPSDVETVVINGEIVMENRTLQKINIHKLMEKIEKTKECLLARLRE